MDQQLSTALLLLAVGMITVFIILSLVVFTGRVLIRIVNRFHKEERDFVMAGRMRLSRPKKSIDDSQLAAIIAAVEFATHGQGRIQSIQKIDPVKE